MKMKRLLLGMVVACGMVGTVQADMLLSGPVYGGPRQNHVACVVFNGGTTPINFISTQIFEQFNSPTQLNYNDCNALLGPNKTCSFQAAAINQAYSCKVRTVQVKTNVRGTMISLNSSNTSLSESDLR